MAVEIRVPALGESVVEATIARWLKTEGEPVTAGEPLVELETDKVNVEVAAEENGVLGAISRKAGDTVSVGEVLGTLAAGGGNGATPAPAQPTPATQTSAAASAPASEHAPAATPVAQKIAQENNIDLAQVKGTGPGGRITKENVADLVEQKASAPASAVEQAAQTQQRVAQAEATQAAAPPVSAPVGAAPLPNAASGPLLPAAFGDNRQTDRVRMTTRRRTIAKRLVEAQHTAAMLTTFNEVDMSAVMALRTKRKDQFKERFGVNLGFMSFFTKAVIGALKAFPNLNAEITTTGDEILVKRFYDIGIAVGVEEGLVVPVVRDADKKTFAEIEKTIGDLAARAKENKLKLDELQGGTFTITNGGVFGSLMSTPILNAPQVGILGMHTIQERPVARDGQVVIRPMMYVALSYDHRIVDGGEAVRFLVRVKQLIEDPESLLLEG